MERRHGWKTALALGVTAAALHAAQVLATPATGFSATTLALGRLGEIDVKNHLGGRDVDDEKSFWRSVQRTRGESDLYVQSNVWVPGGSTGWHTHPGHSLIIVTQGTVTVYEADDRACKPHVYSTGESFVDQGGEHVHAIRNEGPGEARTIAVQLVPRGAARRTDAPSPMTCPF